MDEYISREAVNNIIKDMQNNHFILMSERANLALLKSKVAEIPAADVQPVKFARWIDSELKQEIERLESRINKTNNFIEFMLMTYLFLAIAKLIVALII